MVALRSLASAPETNAYVKFNVLSLDVLSLYDTRYAIYDFTKIPTTIRILWYYTTFCYQFFDRAGIFGEVIDLEVDRKKAKAEAK